MEAGIKDSTPDGRDEIDLNGVFAALRDNKRLIVRATIGASAAALIFCLMSSPRYLAEARILIENQESYFTSAAPEGAREPEPVQTLDAEAVNSQIQLLTSRDLARKAIQKLGLKGNPEFDPDASFLSALKRPLTLIGIGGAQSDDAPGDRMINTFIDHLTVLSPSKTRVLQVEFTSRDPDLAAKAANVVAELYIDLKSQAKRVDAHQAAQALKPLIATLESRVAEADAKVETFRARTGLYENSDNATVPTQQLGEIATKLAEARAAQSELEAKARNLRDLLKQGRLADAGDISSNDLVRRIAEQRVSVRSQLAVESRTLLPAHPRIKELEAQLNDLDTQLRAAVDKAARGFDVDARTAAARVANLTQLLDDQKSQVGASNSDAAQLRELQRDEKILKDQLSSLAAKYQAALARDVADSAPPDARVISRALAPSQPVFPKTVPITIFASLAGLFFSTAYVVARELTGTRAAVPVSEPARRPRREAPAVEEKPVVVTREAEPEETSHEPFLIEPKPDRAAAENPFEQKPLGDEPKAEADSETTTKDGADEPIKPGSIAELKQAFFGLKKEKIAPLKEQAAAPASEDGLLKRIKQAAVEFAAPAVVLAPPAIEPVEAPPAKFVDAEDKRERDGDAGASAPKARGAASRAIVERITAARAVGGAKVLVTSDSESAEACASLTLARAMAREGRAILVQIDDSDAHLADALALADGRDEFDEPQPGLAQLLLGEASFAETIYRDGSSRLHIIQSGGSLRDEGDDLDLILDALQSTYDFVLVAAGAEGSDAARMSADADLTVIFAEDARARDFLYDDFAAAGARAVLLAGVDSLGEIVEMAA